MPASIQNGLRHFGLDQLGTTHIAHEDDAIAFRQVRREFMCCIFAPVPWAGPIEVLKRYVVKPILSRL